MKKLHVFFLLSFTVLAANAQSVSETVGKKIGFSKSTTATDAQVHLKLCEISTAVALYSTAVEEEKQQRNGGKGVSGELLAEYAYALALHHDFEAALINIDRARALGAKHSDFYSAQILELMGHKESSQQLMKGAEIPDWINGVYQNLTPKHITTFAINEDSPKNALERANRLATGKQTVQSIVLFEELQTLYPKVGIVYIDHSSVWESLGKKEHAANLLRKGIGLIPNGMADSASNAALEMHLKELEDSVANVTKITLINKMLGVNPPKLITYAGASFAKDLYSLNGRLGVYTSNKLSASLNVGLNYVGKSFIGNIGISAYKTWNIFVVGLGVSEQLSKDNMSFSLSPTVGLSFLNKAQTSSFDINLNWFIPLVSDAKSSYSISIGKTIYLDMKGARK